MEGYSWPGLDLSNSTLPIDLANSTMEPSETPCVSFKASNKSTCVKNLVVPCSRLLRGNAAVASSSLLGFLIGAGADEQLQKAIPLRSNFKISLHLLIVNTTKMMTHSLVISLDQDPDTLHRIRLFDLYAGRSSVCQYALDESEV